MIKCTRKSSCVFVCVEVIKKTSDICLFRAGGQQTQVGLLSDWNVFVPKGHLQFPDEGFLNYGIWVRFNGQENVLRTRIIRDNTAPCWAKENIHMNVELLFQYFFFIFYFFIFVKNDCPALFLSAGETRNGQ